MKGMSSIDWRNCALASSVELPAAETLILNVEYPESREGQAGRRCAIVFDGVHAHEVKEMPLPGAPTIVDASLVASGEGLHTLCIETSTGMRVVSARQVRLEPGWHYH